MEISEDSVLYEDVSFQDMKVAELRAALKARNLPTSGLRSDLIARLQEAASSTKDPAEVDEDDVSDAGSDIPSQVSIFADSQLTEDLHEDEILNDSPTKPGRDTFSSMKTSYDDKALTEVKPPTKMLKPLKRTTTMIPSNGSEPSEKKICIDRTKIHEPVTSESVVDESLKKFTHTPITVDSEDKSSTSVKPVTPQEKLALRAKRFNISGGNSVIKTTKTNLLTKGITPNTTKSNITPITFGSVPDMDKLKKRAERFGVVSSLLKKIEEKNKVKQRQERFGKTGTISLKSKITK